MIKDVSTSLGMTQLSFRLGEANGEIYRIEQI